MTVLCWVIAVLAVLAFDALFVIVIVRWPLEVTGVWATLYAVLFVLESLGLRGRGDPDDAPVPIARVVRR